MSFGPPELSVSRGWPVRVTRGLKGFQALPQPRQLLGDGVGNAAMIQLLHLSSGHAHHARRDAHRRGVIRDGLQDDGVGSDARVVPTRKEPSTLAPLPTRTLLPRVGWRLCVSFPEPPRVTP